MNRNRGFSLIELVVALAIFAIAGIAVFGFMSYSSNNYSRTNGDVKLQYEQQLAVNQIRDAILEATNGIYYDAAGQFLVIYSQTTDTDGNVTYPVTKISFDAVDSKMYMAQKVFTAVADIAVPATTEDKLLAENVTAFSVDLSRVKKNKVQFSMTFAIGDKEQSVNPVVALRNHLLVSDAVDSIYEKAPVEVNSFIKSIVIKRGETVFSQGGTDTVKKYGDVVSVQYQAVVTGTQDSTREYAVTWSTGSTNSGISVKDGLVTVSKNVPTGTEFSLTATSVDDPTKYAKITITVEDNGVYPVSAALLNDDNPYNGNGYRQYTLQPTLTDTNNAMSNDPVLFDWKGVSSLPAGCSFNAKTGELYLTESASGLAFEIYVVAKEHDANGKAVISNTITIVVGTIPPYQSGPTLKLSVPSELLRGGGIEPLVSWQNSNTSNYTYTWKISAYQDAESEEWKLGNNNNNNGRYSFYQCVSASVDQKKYTSQNGVIELTTSRANRSIYLGVTSRLHWKKTFKIKIEVSAKDAKGNVIYAEPQYTTINPVTLTLVPTGAVSYNPDKNYVYPTSDVLVHSDWHDMIRWFTTQFTGLYIYTQKSENTVGGWNGYGSGKAEGEFIFYNQAGTLLDNKKDISNLPTTIIFDSNMAVGFWADPSNWKNYPNRPSTMNYYFYLKDKYGNEVLSSNNLSYKIDYGY